MEAFWNERYAESDYAYGKNPNGFFKWALEKHPPQKRVLFGAEGEGRNAVYAAKQGYEVTAFDISEEAKKKAKLLAEEQKVEINYLIGDFMTMPFKKGEFDAVVLIFAHFPPNLIEQYHQKLGSLVKKGGYIILEGFSKNNLPLRQKNPAIGGPANVDMLFSCEQIQAQFDGFDPLVLKETMTSLDEGQYHQGEASVVQFIGQKTQAKY